MRRLDVINRGLPDLDVALERDRFLRDLLRHLANVLQDVVGVDEAAGFISVVGQEMGEAIGREYRAALGVNRLAEDQIAAVLIDLKRRIQGDFYVAEMDAEKIVFGNRSCPFGDRVLDRPALCMMTSNVFGAIASRENGYAKVELRETIAARAPECRVVVHLRRPAGDVPGREYMRSIDDGDG